MGLLVKDIMKTKLFTASPEMSVIDLERMLFGEKVSGAPVIDEAGHLTGIVSRSDIVRKLVIEQCFAEIACDFYSDPFKDHPTPDRDTSSIGKEIGKRLQGLTVQDVMSKDLITIESAKSIEALAQLMMQKQVHRVLVVENESLIGFVTSIDLVQLFAENRVSTS